MEHLDTIDIDSADFLKDPRQLPPLPDCVVKMQGMISRPDVSVESVSRLLMNEPVLTAHILRIVNSAYYGFRREVDDVKFAVAYLGIHEIYNIVVSLSVVKTLGIEEKDELEAFWSHSVLTALCARHLGKCFEPLLSPERIWLGAVLHDIGKLVYFRFFPDHYKAIKEYSKKHGVLFSDGEKHFALPASGHLGGILCERWHLPTIVRDACEGHDVEDLDNDSGGSRGDFRRIICAANLMAILSTDDLNHDVKLHLFDRLKAHFKMNDKEFLQLMGEVYDLKLDLANYRW